jgi:hypothetical protein
MMAAIGAARIRAPALWLALPHAPATPVRRSRAAEQRLRDALLARMQREGLAAARGAGLSHSGGHVACGVPARGVVGVDLEWFAPRRVLPLAEFAFSAGETAALAAVPESRRGEAFLDLWVLKEAAAKALGLPLLTALARCQFTVAGSSIEARWPVQPMQLGAVAMNWSARLYAPRPGLKLAWLSFASEGEAAGMEPNCHEWIGDEDVLKPVRWECVGAGAGNVARRQESE